jgi:hypothetical protein
LRSVKSFGFEREGLAGNPGVRAGVFRAVPLGGRVQNWLTPERLSRVIKRSSDTPAGLRWAAADNTHSQSHVAPDQGCGSSTSGVRKLKRFVKECSTEREVAKKHAMNVSKLVGISPKR